jgi:hypothetical protein
MTLPFSLNFQPPRISERNTPQRCAADMAVEKIVNKYNDVNFLFSVTASKTILPFPKLQVTENSRDTWDFNPAGVVDLNTISQYRQLLTDCVKCIVGTFEWASFYQTLHKQSPSFVEGKRMIVFHYTIGKRLFTFEHMFERFCVRTKGRKYVPTGRSNVFLTFFLFLPSSNLRSELHLQKCWKVLTKVFLLIP